MYLSQTNNRDSLNVLYVILILALMQLFIALLTNGFALSADEAMWHYIGRNWFRNGLVPYSGGVDNKSPLFFAVFGLSDKFFGVNYWFPRVIATLLQSIGIMYVYKIAKYVAGHRAGMLAISFYGLSVLWHGADGKYVASTEVFDIAFLIAAFYYFVTAKGKGGYFIAGFVAAIGVAFRLSAVFGIAALFTASFRQSKASTLFFFSGVLSGILLLAILGTLAGINLHDVYVYMLADNFGAGSTTDHGLVWRLIQFFNLFFYSETILFYPLILVYLFIKRKIDWLILWLLFTFLGINIIGNYARVDLKDILPAMALIAAVTTANFIDVYKISMQRVMIIVWICFSPKLLEPIVSFHEIFKEEISNPADYCHEPYIQPDERACKSIGRWVKANTGSDETVYVAGYGAEVQVYTERISPTIYFNATQTSIAKARFYKDMKQNKPGMILVPLYSSYRIYIDADLRAYVDTLVAKDYIFDRCVLNYNVYRLKVKQIGPETR